VGVRPIEDTFIRRRVLVIRSRPRSRPSSTNRPRQRNVVDSGWATRSTPRKSLDGGNEVASFVTDFHVIPTG